MESKQVKYTLTGKGLPIRQNLELKGVVAF